nr:MAG TPA: hypothetical protein [Caudoviricetes sp.]
MTSGLFSSTGQSAGIGLVAGILASGGASRCSSPRKSAFRQSRFLVGLRDSNPVSTCCPTIVPGITAPGKGGEGERGEREFVLHVLHYSL